MGKFIKIRVKEMIKQSDNLKLINLLLPNMYISEAYKKIQIQIIFFIFYIVCFSELKQVYFIQFYVNFMIFICFFYFLSVLQVRQFSLIWCQLQRQMSQLYTISIKKNFKSQMRKSLSQSKYQ
ncbi:transmembrane protein, putative (macronuclear) [Tetrahymena thermophila SB210]|uniref:Transmembrane protein, putative n=1 Tax=Tetrahymena thermophila (strain SB210) TaxID=312017 RepID=W7XBD1_TETTS|nr:transmembrane protein, putative [Tetrahymena thermophila SB210]EWS70986.1 transmembrane protein, putative [Tetrahymena thermophila SB210]|eukprot:XP_012656470.1 transmembrane protein, putative [Tetrahymena thermophila SB210]